MYRWYYVYIHIWSYPYICIGNKRILFFFSNLVSVLWWDSRSRRLDVGFTGKISHQWNLKIGGLPGGGFSFRVERNAGWLLFLLQVGWFFWRLPYCVTSPHLYEGRNRPYVVLAISCIYGGEFPTKIIIQTIQKIFAHFFLKYKNARGGICVRTSSKSIIYIYILYILHFCQKIFKICLISNARSQQKSSILRPPRFTDDLL